MQPHPPEESVALSPLGAALVEMVTVRNWGRREALRWLNDRFEQDMSVPLSGLFTERAVRSFYAESGVAVNVIRLPAARG